MQIRTDLSGTMGCRMGLRVSVLLMLGNAGVLADMASICNGFHSNVHWSSGTSDRVMQEARRVIQENGPEKRDIERVLSSKAQSQFSRRQVLNLLKAKPDHKNYQSHRLATLLCRRLERIADSSATSVQPSTGGSGAHHTSSPPQQPPSDGADRQASQSEAVDDGSRPPAEIDDLSSADVDGAVYQSVPTSRRLVTRSDELLSVGGFVAIESDARDAASAIKALCATAEALARTWQHTATGCTGSGSRLEHAAQLLKIIADANIQIDRRVYATQLRTAASNLGERSPWRPSAAGLHAFAADLCSLSDFVALK